MEDRLRNNQILSGRVFGCTSYSRKILSSMLCGSYSGEKGEAESTQGRGTCTGTDGIRQARHLRVTNGQ